MASTQEPAGQGTTWQDRGAARGSGTTKAVGALAGLAVTAGIVVAGGAPASARPCDIGVSVCHSVTVSPDHLSPVRYP